MEFETLKKVISDVLGVDPNEITEETTFADDLGADSLDLYQILLELQDQLKLEVDEDALKDVKTVGDALDLIKNAKA